MRPTGLALSVGSSKGQQAWARLSAEIRTKSISLTVEFDFQCSTDPKNALLNIYWVFRMLGN